MVDPVDIVSSLLRTAAGTDAMVRRSERADLQADVAMGLARERKKAPLAIANDIVHAIPANDVISRAEVAPPGFINITLRDEWLAAAATRAMSDERLGVPRAETRDRVVVDYSHPNVAKEMHVGHLRSTVIGDALARVLAWRGHTVIRQNHIGDWGTPFGMLIEHLVEIGEAQAAAQLGIGELATFYRAANTKFENDPDFAARARGQVVALQSGQPEARRLWHLLIALSQQYFEAVYARLGVLLEPGDIAGESFYNDRLAPLAAELEASGYARISDGALCAFPAGFTGRTGAPQPLMVRKSDGGFGYGATDLAAIRYRLAELGATRILYVVGAPQTNHLAMVFAAAHELGWLPDLARAQHVAFGSVLDQDGNIYRSRHGDTERLVDLIDDAVANARSAAEAKGLDAAILDDIARVVGIGAIKYADLANDRRSDYKFNLDKMTSFDGNTAAFVQYAHARACSVLRKAGSAPETIEVAEPAEHALALQLLSLGSTVRAVDAKAEPHRLVQFAFASATAFTNFYDACPILGHPGRLALTALSARTLRQALALLGIDAPERM